MAKPTKLEPKQITERLATISGWTLNGNDQLTKSFKCENFVDAIGFANKITPLAESAGHHPDLFVKYGEVRVYLSTHDVGGISEADFSLATAIDKIV